MIHEQGVAARNLASCIRHIRHTFRACHGKVLLDHEVYDLIAHVRCERIPQRLWSSVMNVAASLCYPERMTEHITTDPDVFVSDKCSLCLACPNSIAESEELSAAILAARLIFVYALVSALHHLRARADNVPTSFHRLKKAAANGWSARVIRQSPGENFNVAVPCSPPEYAFLAYAIIT